MLALGLERRQFLKMTDMQKIEKLCPDAPISREPGAFPALGYHGWPSVAVDEKGVTYVVASKRLLHIDPYGMVMLYKSADGGLTWDEGRCIYDTVLDDRDAGIVYMGGGRMLVTTFSHDSSNYVTNPRDGWVCWQREVGVAETERVFGIWNSSLPENITGCSSYIISDDYGRTWSDRHLIPVTAPHGPSLMKDGTLLYLGIPKAPVFATGENLDDGVYCFVSTDRGETFSLRSKIEIDPAFRPCEAYGIELSDGTIVGTVRTGDFRTLVFRSTDGGFSWTEAKELTYGAPAHLIETPGGLLVCTYSKRKDGTGQCIRVSRDGGANWSEETYISSPADPTDGDLGYPATAAYPDGSFITVYYQRWGKDKKTSLVRTLWRFK